MVKNTTLILAKEVRDSLLLVSEMTHRDSWVSRENLPLAFEALEKTKGLTQFAYEEERVEEILQRVIEKNRAILIELIKQDNTLKTEEQKAIAAVQKISEALKGIETHYSDRNSLHIDPVRKILRQVNEIISLLEQDAKIEQALSVVASDLASLIAILPRGEK
ncbi:hypothetical protein EXS74_03215 [Candidatus Woesearchaeota archaeon]|nr:hypothetical protein [Candidatus Woesearchaeota archaeon]